MFTGNINSFLTISYVIFIALGSTNTKNRVGLFTLVTSLTALISLISLTYVGVIPRMNVLRAGKELSLESMLVGLSVISLTCLQTYFTITAIAKSNAALLKKVRVEQERSDGMLFAILPKDVAEEIKANGSYKPVRIESATVIFTDFVDFTKSTSGVEPISVISFLNRYFTVFDEIASRYGIERLKTIGDGYMCAGGVPIRNNTHPIDACLAAIDLLNYVKNAWTEPGFKWDIRIGIHTGPLIAGIIGKVRYSYDVWGETVNIASRHEASGIAGGINVSKATYLLTKEFFKYRERGPVEIKDKRRLEMFELCGLRDEYEGTGANSISERLSAVYGEIRSGKKILGYDT
jgi:class 3 adenylate cyclase